jgi:hypothetical protein
MAARVAHEPGAMVSRNAPCFAGPLRGVRVAVLASLAEPLALMSRPGARAIVTIH